MPPSTPTTTRTGAASTPTRSALSYANTVLIAKDATADQREHAGYYQDDATAMLANTAS
jgi:hypothetical protein